MGKNKRFFVILAIFILAVSLLTGCSDSAEGELELKGGSELSETQGKQGKDVSGDEQQSEAGEVDAEITGTVKEVDSNAGKVIITAEGGTDLMLDVSSKEMLTTLANLVDKAETQVLLDYDTDTQTVMNVTTLAENNAKAAVTKANGKVKTVNPKDGTVIIAAKGGEEISLKITPESKVLHKGLVLSLIELAAIVDSDVSVEYDLHTKTVITLDVQD